MRFHLPKPLHGWREFAGEVGIIVLGVLIALGAQQIVQNVHDGEVKRETVRAARAEVAAGLGVSLRTAKRIVSRASERVSKHVGNDDGLRSFFERREAAADRPRSGANTDNKTSGKTNVRG